MPRLPRQFIPGLPAHVVHRGNNRGDIFRCEADFLFLRHCMSERRRFGVAIHSYVLMSNHIHLLATPVTPDALSRFIQSVARRYVGYFNSRYLRSGTLWEGRFHASVIREDRYLLACHRYIDMNPVRAGLARTPAEYPCSHRHYLTGEPDTLVDHHSLVDALSSDTLQRQAAYRALFEMPDDDFELAEMREALQACRPTGEGQRSRPLIGRPPKSRL